MCLLSDRHNATTCLWLERLTPWETLRTQCQSCVETCRTQSTALFSHCADLACQQLLVEAGAVPACHDDSHPFSIKLRPASSANHLQHLHTPNTPTRAASKSRDMHCVYNCLWQPLCTGG